MDERVTDKDDRSKGLGGLDGLVVPPSRAGAS